MNTNLPQTQSDYSLDLLNDIDKQELVHYNSQWWNNIPQIWREIFLANLKLREIIYFRHNISHFSPFELYFQRTNKQFNYNDFEVTNDDINLITHLKQIVCCKLGLEDISPIFKLKNISSIICNSNNIKELSISSLPNLDQINCSHNKIKNLKLHNLPKLRNLNCSVNEISSLQIHEFTQLKEINCSKNKIDNLQIDKLKQVRKLYCSDNTITKLQIDKLCELAELECSNNNISNLKTDKLSKLNSINCSNNKLTELDLSNNYNLSQQLNCSNNQIKELEVSHLHKLERLNCNNNKLIDLDLSNLTLLFILNCENNYLTELDLSNLKRLQYFRAMNNRIINLNFDIVLEKISDFDIQNNKLTNLQLDFLPNVFNLFAGNNNLSKIQCSKELPKLSRMSCFSNYMLEDISFINKATKIYNMVVSHTKIDISLIDFSKLKSLRTFVFEDCNISKQTNIYEAHNLEHLVFNNFFKHEYLYKKQFPNLKYLYDTRLELYGNEKKENNKTKLEIFIENNPNCDVKANSWMLDKDIRKRYFHIYTSDMS